MTRRRAARPLLLATVILLLTGSASACSGSEGDPAGPATSPSATTSRSAEAACARVSRTLVAAVQRYVDAYGAPLSSMAGRPDPGQTVPDDQDLQRALRGATQALQSQGCDLATFRTDLRTGLDRVRTRGPVARAVLLRLSASLTGSAKEARATVRLRPGADLPTTLAELAAGSVVRLSPGTYRLPSTLALLQGVTLRGAGPGRTVLESTAGDAGLLVLTDARVELRGLTLRHHGPRTGDVVVAGATASLVLTDVRVTGGRASRDRQVGNGLLMTAARGATPRRGTTLQVTGSRFDGNGASGILLTGGHVASIRRSSFVGNAECGVCFAGATSGAVRASTFSGNRIGLGALDRARPTLVDSTVGGGTVGVQASGRARLMVREVRIDGASRAAMIFSEHARGRVEAARCENVPYGIVVSPGALPFLGDNTCTLARGG